MIILRQQYRLHPSWSIASLETRVSDACFTVRKIIPTRLGHRRPGAEDIVPIDHQRPDEPHD